MEAELRLLEVILAQASAPNLPINDKEDPWVLACALQAKVDYFVTGDAELLAFGLGQCGAAAYYFSKSLLG